jgi:putative N6-adenine-specific DNA methylase
VNLDELRQVLLEGVRPTTTAQIQGSDRDAGAIAAAQRNAERAGVAGDIQFVQSAVSGAPVPAGESGWLATNPPYGARLGRPDDVRDLYAQFGKVIRQRWPSWRVAMVSASPALEAQTGLRWDCYAKTDNGGIPVRFVRSGAPGAAW